MRLAVSPDYDFALPDGFELVEPDQFDPSPPEDDDELQARAAAGQPLVSYMEGVLPPERYEEAERLTREAVLQGTVVEREPGMHPSIERLQVLVESGGSLVTLQGSDGSALMFMGFPPDCPAELEQEVFGRLDFRVKGGGAPHDEDGAIDLGDEWLEDWDDANPAVVDLEGEYGPFDGFETKIRQYRHSPMLWVVGLDPWPEGDGDGEVDGEPFWEWTHRRFAARLRSLRRHA